MQFLRAFFDLALEVGVGFLQPAGHVVELVGERLDLVAGLDGDALAEVSAAEAGGAGAQRVDRHHHTPGEEHAGGKRQRERAEKDEPGALQRGIERRVGLLHRRFDENEPAKGRDRRRSDQHLVSGDVVGLFDLLAIVAGYLGAGAAHLGKLRHVGVAQHQADVGVSDETAGGINHISAPVPGKFDLRQHVPDEFQVDLGDAHAGVAPRAGERQRHVGLGFAAEIDRAVVDLVRHRLGEARLLGHVGAAADHFHGQPRHLQLLVAAGVDLGEFGDRRHLAQEPQRVETSLLKRTGRPGQLRGPADLAFDFADELPDLAGRGLRLLALNADQRGLLLLIREIDVEHAVGDEREADDGDEQHDVFDEQPAAHDRGAGGRSDAAQAGRQPANASGAMIRQRCHAIVR